MAADDGPILASCKHRLDEAELAKASLECVELVFADPTGIGRVRTQQFELDLLDDQGGDSGGEAHRSFTDYVDGRR